MAGVAKLVLMTAPDAEVAERIVHALVSERLAACGNLVPGLTSVFRWQGRVERSAEVLVILKTTAEAVPALLARIPELHPYEVPEALVLPIEAGHGPYLDWVGDSVESRSRTG